MAKYNSNILLIAIAGLAVIVSGCTVDQDSTPVQDVAPAQTATGVQTTSAEQTASAVQTSIQSQTVTIIQPSTSVDASVDAPVDMPVDTSVETPIQAPTAGIIAENNPDTAGYDLKIRHKGGDTLKGGEWKLSIVPIDNQTAFITSASGFDISAGTEIEVTVTTEGTASLT